MKYSLIKNLMHSKGSIDTKSKNIFRALLKDQQRAIFDALLVGEEKAVSCNFIKTKTGIPTKNITVQIKQLAVNYPIGVIEVNRGYNKYYKKE